MTPRRGGRTSQVRPRPPSTGRPAPERIRARPPVTGRVATRPRLQQRRGLPLAARLVLAVAIVALGAFVTYTATGGLGQIVAAFGSSVEGFLDDLTATPAPSPSQAIVSDAPLITPPANAYTNVATADLEIAVPADARAEGSTAVRIYLALPDQFPAPIQDVLLTAAPRLLTTIELTEGRNDISATLIGPAGESESSPTVTFILDTTPPTITLTSPKAGAIVNRATVELQGTTQAASRLVARNEANGGSVTGQAGDDGAFTLVLPIVAGPNGITLAATDPAGNVTETVVAVRRGSGQLTAVLSASAYRVSLARLPTTLELTATVTDPDGRPLSGATVTFTLSIPGIPVVTQEAGTRGDGRAVFRTTVPAGATQGTGPATIFVDAGELGQVMDRTVITFAR